MSKKRILFVTAPYHCGVVEVAGRWLPLQFVYLAGSARKAGYDVELFDAMSLFARWKDIEGKVTEVNPDVVGLTAITATIKDNLKIARLVKKINPKIKVVIGGVHPTFMFEEVLRSPYIDFVVIGEGEMTLYELLLAIDSNSGFERVKGVAFRKGGELYVTPPREFVKDLDALEVAWEIVDWKIYRYFVPKVQRLGAVSGSRGCHFDCTFCSQQKMWKKTWRSRAPEKVADEIEMLAREFGVKVILLTDEYPTSDRERWEKFLDELIIRKSPVQLLIETRVEDIVRDRDIMDKYKEAGIVHIYIGVESPNQDTLDRIKKDINVEISLEAIRIIQEHGMITETSFVLGFPEDTRESIKNILDLSLYYNPDFAHYLAITPWPYSDLYKEVERYIEVKDYSKYNLIEPIIKPLNMTRADVDKAIMDCYKKFYYRKWKSLKYLKDKFVKEYLLRSMKLIMRSSFLRKKMKDHIPSEVKKILAG